MNRLFGLEDPPIHSVVRATYRLMAAALQRDSSDAAVMLAAYPVRLMIRGIGVGVTESFSALSLYASFYRLARRSPREGSSDDVAQLVESACTDHLMEAWRLIIGSYSRDPATSAETLSRARQEVALAVIHLVRQTVIARDLRGLDELLRRWRIAVVDEVDDGDHTDRRVGESILDDARLAAAYEASRQHRRQSAFQSLPFFEAIAKRGSAAGLFLALERQYSDTAVIDLSDLAFADLPVDEGGVIDWQTDAVLGLLSTLASIHQDDRSLRAIKVGPGIRSHLDRITTLLPIVSDRMREVEDVGERTTRIASALATAVDTYDAEARARVRSQPMPDGLDIRLASQINEAFRESVPFGVLQRAGSVSVDVAAAIPGEHRRMTQRLLQKSWFLAENAVANEAMVIRRSFAAPFAEAERQDLTALLISVPVRWARVRSLRARLLRAIAAVTPQATHLIVPHDWEVRGRLLEEGLAQVVDGDLQWNAEGIEIVEMELPERDVAVGYVLSLPRAIRETRFQLQPGEPLSVHVTWPDEAQAAEMAAQGFRITDADEDSMELAIREHFLVRAESGARMRLVRSAVSALPLSS